MATAAELYGKRKVDSRFTRTLTQLRQQKLLQQKREEAYQRELKEYKKTPGYKELQKYETYKKELEKHKASREYQETQGYYVIGSRKIPKSEYDIVQTNGTIVIEQKRKTIDPEYADTYSPHRLTIKKGKLVSEKYFAGVDLIKSIGYGEKTRTEKAWDVIGSATKLRSEKKFVGEHLVSQEHFDTSKYGKKDFVPRVYDPTTPAGKRWREMELKRAGYTEQQISKAKVSTPEAQRAEFGKVLFQTAKPLTKTQYERARVLTEAEQMRRYGRIVQKQTTRHKAPTYVSLLFPKGHPRADQVVTVRTGAALAEKLEKDLKRKPEYSLLGDSKVVAPIITLSKEEQRIKRFEERIIRLQKWDKKYKERLERIQKTAAIITQPKAWRSKVYTPFEQRGLFGRVSEGFVGGIMSIPALPETTIIASAKIAATAEALTFVGGKERVIEESKKAALEASQIYKDPATYITAAAFALPGAVSMVKAGKPIISIKTATVRGTKTTFVKAPFEFGYKTPSGKRAVIFTKGKQQPPISEITGAVVKVDRAIVPYKPKTTPIRPLITYQPEPKGLIKLRAKEAKRAISEEVRILQIEEARRGIRPLTSISAKQRRLIRKDIVAKKSIKPLDIPRDYFKSIPKGEPKGLIKLRKKEALRESKSLIISDIVEGKIKLTPGARKDVRKQVRKRLARIEFTRMEREGIPKVPSFFRATEKPLPEPKGLVKLRAKEAKRAISEEVRILQIEEARTGLRPLTSISAKQRRLIRKKYVPEKVKGTPSYFELLEKEIKERPATLTLRKGKWLRTEEYRKLKVEEARKGIRPLTTISAKQRRIIKKEYIPEKARKAKPLGIFPIGYFIKSVRAWKIVKKDKSLDIYRKKTPTREIIKRKPEEYREIRTPTGQILLQKTKKVTKKVLKKKLKKKPIYISDAVAPSAYVETIGFQEYYQPIITPQEAISARIKGQQRTSFEQFYRRKQAAKLGVIPMLASLQRPKAEQKEISKLNILQAQYPIQKQPSQQAQLQGQIQLIDVGLKLDTTQIPITDQTQEQLQDRIQRQREEQREKLKEEIEEELTPPETPFDFDPRKKKSIFIQTRIATPTSQQGYNVLVKRKQLKKGKGSYQSRGYEKANTIPLTKEAALGLGAGLVDTYTNRSFKLQRAGKVKEERKDLETKWNILKNKFRPKKNNKTILVEKTKHAIDSYEEKQGIPYEAARQRDISDIRIRMAQLASTLKPIKKGLKGKDIIQKTALEIAKRKQVIYGSGASSLVARGIKPADIDINTPTPKEDALKLIKVLKKKGVKAELKSRLIKQIRRKIYEVGSVSFSPAERQKQINTMIIAKRRYTTPSKEVLALSGTVIEPEKYHRKEKDIRRLKLIGSMLKGKKKAEYSKLLKRLQFENFSRRYLYSTEKSSRLKQQKILLLKSEFKKTKSRAKNQLSFLKTKGGKTKFL